MSLGSPGIRIYRHILLVPVSSRHLFVCRQLQSEDWTSHASRVSTESQCPCRGRWGKKKNQKPREQTNVFEIVLQVLAHSDGRDQLKQKQTFKASQRVWDPFSRRSLAAL